MKALFYEEVDFKNAFLTLIPTNEKNLYITHRNSIYDYRREIRSLIN